MACCSRQDKDTIQIFYIWNRLAQVVALLLHCNKVLDSLVLFEFDHDSFSCSSFDSQLIDSLALRVKMFVRQPCFKINEWSCSVQGVLSSLSDGLMCFKSYQIPKRQDVFCWCSIALRQKPSQVFFLHVFLLKPQLHRRNRHLSRVLPRLDFLSKTCWNRLQRPLILTSRNKWKKMMDEWPNEIVTETTYNSVFYFCDTCFCIDDIFVF